MKQTTQLKQRDHGVFEPLEQGNSPGSRQPWRKWQRNPWKGIWWKRSQIPHHSVFYKTARIDIFITEKKTDQVRAGSIKPELVQGWEMGQLWRDLKARPETFTENNTWKKFIWGNDKQSTQSSGIPQQTQKGQPQWEKVSVQRIR